MNRKLWKKIICWKLTTSVSPNHTNTTKHFSLDLDFAKTALIWRCFKIAFYSLSSLSFSSGIFYQIRKRNTEFSHQHRHTRLFPIACFLYLLLRFSHFPWRMMTLYAIWILNVQFMIRTTDNINLSQRIEDFLGKSFYLRRNFSIWSFPFAISLDFADFLIMNLNQAEFVFHYGSFEKRRLIKIETWNYLV